MRLVALAGHLLDDQAEDVMVGVAVLEPGAGLEAERCFADQVDPLLRRPMS